MAQGRLDQVILAAIQQHKDKGLTPTQIWLPYTLAQDFVMMCRAKEQDKKLILPAGFTPKGRNMGISHFNGLHVYLNMGEELVVA